MIEQLLSHREAIPYALAISAIILAMTVGYKLGAKDPTLVCSEYIIKADRLQNDIDELTLKLARCEAKKAGGQALECGDKIKGAVSKALADYKDVVCSD